MKTALKVFGIAALPIALGAAISGDTTSPYTILSVQGTGYGAQDVEYLTINASYTGWSSGAGDIVSKNASVLDDLRTTLKRNGISEQDFRTSTFRFSEASDPDDNDGGRRKGFAIEQTLTVVVRDVPRAGDIIEALVDAGAKNISVGQGWGYASRPAAKDLTNARLAAIRDAQVKAEDYARALGLKIRRVVQVRDSSSYSIDGPPPPMARMEAANTVIDTPKSTLVYGVGVEFELSK